MRPEKSRPGRPCGEQREKPPEKSVSLLGLALLVLVGIALNELFRLAGRALDLPWDVLRLWFGLSLAVLAGALAVFFLWSRRRSRFHREAVALLPLIETDVDAYIAGYEGMKRRWKGAFYQRYICLNLVAGYHDREDFETAARLLREAASYGLPGIARTVWASDLAMTAFRCEQWEEGLAVMAQEQAALRKMEAVDDAGTAAVRAVLSLYVLIAEGRREEACQALPQAEALAGSSRTQKSLSHIRSVLARTEKNGVSGPRTGSDKEMPCEYFHNFSAN